MMELVRERPPLFDEIDAAFNVKGAPILFAWGAVIYAPSGIVDVGRHMQAHEEVHGMRQLAYPGGVEAWWRRYIADPEFRLAEEIVAHVAEYRSRCKDGGGRNERRRCLSITAARLAAPLYGSLISVQDAKRAITKVCDETGHP